MRQPTLPALRGSLRLIGGGIFACLLAGCSDLTDTPVVTLDERVFSAGELRDEWTRYPASLRPRLHSREERLAFVDALIDRELLVARGRELEAAGDPAFDASQFEARRQETIVRRLRVLEAGEGGVDSASVATAWERMRVGHRVEWVSFSSEREAQAAAQRIADAGGLAEELGRPDVRKSLGAELMFWSPYPDPLVDEIETMGIGEVRGPIATGTEYVVAKLVSRQGVDRGSLDSSQPSIARGLRARHTAEAMDTVTRELWVEAGLEIDEDAVRRIAARTGEAILRDGSLETDARWAIPELVAGEESVAVVRDAGGDTVLTIGEYVDTLRRRSIAARPRGNVLELAVRRFIETELERRLLVREAERRDLESDWFLQRSLRRVEHEFYTQTARAAIRSAATATPAQIDSLRTALARTRVDLLRLPDRARVLRFDLPTPEAAEQELLQIRRAGGAWTRLQEVFAGHGAPLGGTYHLTEVRASETPADLESAVFRAGPGRLTGPFDLGQFTSLVYCLELEPARALTTEEANTKIGELLGTDPQAVEKWLRARREATRVVIDEDALDALRPAG